MAATVMTVEFCTIHHYSSLEENSEALFVQFFEQIQKLTEHYVNYGILIWNNRVLNSKMIYKLASSTLYACLTKIMISSLFEGIFEFFFLYL